MQVTQPAAGPSRDETLRRARFSLLACFLIQGASFALLVTRIPAIQRRYDMGDGTLTAVLSVVPIVAGVGSVLAGSLAKRYGSHTVLRVSQPIVCAILIGVGAGDQLWQLAIVLFVFGMSLGAVDATMNMQGVAIQAREGRSIMLGFHASYSLGGLAGAGVAGLCAWGDVPLVLMYAGAAVLTVPAVLAVGSGYLRADPVTVADPTEPVRKIPWGPLLPLCAVMTFAYIGDSTVANWSAVYLEKVLDSSEGFATVPYIAYMVTSLIGRSVGDLGVRRWGMVNVVRAGSVVSALGFAVVLAAPHAAVGLLGFVILGVGLCVIVPQTFAAGGRGAPADADESVARLNIFNYAGFLIGTPLVGGIADLASFRIAMLVPLVLVLAVLPLARAFAPHGEPAHDR
ncbi:MFS transporter [Streptomyces sp. SID3343]|uniref:MFS transporter n=1 Tax=Streptomyces sp. SID3343 TaxID=2690260 RepID=UPI0013692B70|nr:MFS transporter [Streptomyces sp. SID3343]MYV99480.1 MFS transporter [Streptomyces sp. SID3343]